jgi:hypothetical protein
MGLGKKEVSMPAGDDQGQGLRVFRLGVRGSLALVEQDSVNMALDMIDGDERQALSEGEGFGIGDSHQERSCQTRPCGDGNGVEVIEGDVGLGESGTNDGHDGAQVLAAGDLRHDSAVTGVSCDLGSDNGREGAGSTLDNCGGGFVAGGFYAEDEASLAHLYSLAG